MISQPPRRETLDHMVGSRENGQDVRLTGAEQPIPVSAPANLWVSPWILVPYGATSGALDANDALGNTITIDQSVLGDGLPPRGRILSIEMIDQDDDTLAATIHVFNRTFTAAASDAAFTIALVDAPKQVAVELFDSGTDEGSYKFFTIKNVNKEYYAPSDGTGKRALYAQLSSTGTPNIASAAVMPLIRFNILPLD